METYLAKHHRIDKRDFTLKLKSDIINLYFKTIIGEGRWNKEFRKTLASRYFLSDAQYDRLSPPDLSQTKLHLIEGLDMTGLSNTFYQLHENTRNIAKLFLKLYETQGAVELMMSDYVPTKLREEDGVRPSLCGTT